MVCDKCDPQKIHRYDNVEKIVIPALAIQVQKNELINFEIKECRECNQQFGIANITKIR